MGSEPCSMAGPRGGPVFLGVRSRRAGRQAQVDKLLCTATVHPIGQGSGPERGGRGSFREAGGGLDGQLDWALGTGVRSHCEAVGHTAAAWLFTFFLPAWPGRRPSSLVGQVQGEPGQEEQDPGGGAVGEVRWRLQTGGALQGQHRDSVLPNIPPARTHSVSLYG